MFKPMPMNWQCWSLVLICFGSEVWPTTGLRNKSCSFAARKPKLYFTHKRNPDLGSLSKNDIKIKIFQEARLLGATLDSKLTRKPQC